jgi:hypothetical protein
LIGGEEERMAQERAIEGLRAVNALLKKFSQDDDLKEDLQKPQVIMVRVQGCQKHILRSRAVLRRLDSGLCD